MIDLHRQFVLAMKFGRKFLQNFKERHIFVLNVVVFPMSWCSQLILVHIQRIFDAILYTNRSSENEFILYISIFKLTWCITANASLFFTLSTPNESAKRLASSRSDWNRSLFWSTMPSEELILKFHLSILTFKDKIKLNLQFLITANQRVHNCLRGCPFVHFAAFLQQILHNVAKIGVKL